MSTFAGYYHKDLKTFFAQVVPDGNTSVEILNEHSFNGKYDYILLPNSLAYIEDVQGYIRRLRKICRPKTRIVVCYYNFLWKPILDLASLAGLRRKDPKEPNWLTPEDISTLFLLEGFDEVHRGRRLLLPVDLGLVSAFVNRFIAQLPIVNHFCITTYQTFKQIPKRREYSVSIIIPARNEEGNIKGILKRIPPLGRKTEIIFVEGNSRDNTYQAIKTEIANYRGKFSTKLYKQKGRGKGNAVRLGFKKASNDILLILDADLAVDARELLKFYRALSRGYAEFANGSRLVYPMEKQAMRTLNYLGNKIFSLIFSFLLGQQVKDTLCGTKAMFRKDYSRLVQNRKFFGDFDPFGDFDLLFGARKLNLRIIDIPVRYRDRTYGKTNISRFRHGWLLLKMIFLAAKKIKFT